MHVEESMDHKTQHVPTESFKSKSLNQSRHSSAFIVYVHDLRSLALP